MIFETGELTIGEMTAVEYKTMLKDFILTDVDVAEKVEQITRETMLEELDSIIEKANELFKAEKTLKRAPSTF